MRVLYTLQTADWPAVQAQARFAEAAGFDGLLAMETAHDPFLPLVAAALATTRLELTTGIAVAFPRSPTVAAHVTWDLHVQSGGRFRLGLGSQVKGHNERRFGIPWTPPAPRLKDYVEAMRAVWASWQAGGRRLDHRGSHYALTLMMPDWSPPPTALPMPPVTIAAVGAAMLRVAGEVCDGANLHPCSTPLSVETLTLPAIREGMARAGREAAPFDVIGGGFVATGPDEATVARQREWARSRIAFYGATRAYLPVFALHGLEDLHEELNGLSKGRRWEEMPRRVSDDVLGLFTAAGTYDVIAPEIAAHHAGRSDTIRLDLPPGAERDGDAVGQLVEAVKAIPARGR